MSTTMGVFVALLAIVVVLAACKRQPKAAVERVMSETASTHVDELPKVKDGDSDRTVVEGNGWRIDNMKGTIGISVTEDLDWRYRYGTFKVEPRQGRVRVYIKDEKEGYQYAEGTPGKPGVVSGPCLTWGGKYAFRLQAVDGDAAGVYYEYSLRSK